MAGLTRWLCFKIGLSIEDESINQCVSELLTAIQRLRIARVPQNNINNNYIQ